MTKVSFLKAKCANCGTKFAYMAIYSIFPGMGDPEKMLEMTKCPKCQTTYQVTGEEEPYNDWEPSMGRIIEEKE